MRNLSDMDLDVGSSLRLQVIGPGEPQPRNRYSPRSCKPFDPTTAAAMRLAQLRAEERAAANREDIAALQEIRRSIERELA